MTDANRVRRGRRLVVAATVGLALVGTGLATAFAMTQDPAPSAARSATIAASPGQPAEQPTTTAAGPTATTESTPTEPTTPPPLVLAESAPTGLRIPSIGVDAPIIDLGLQPDGSLEVPATAADVGWYATSPTPGEQGPSILAGHVTYDGPAVFLRLGELTAGDTVEIEREDGSTAVFEVTGVGVYDKDDFPTIDVYANTDHAALRLITCGGAFNPEIGHYESNVIAFADLVSTA